MEYLYIDEYIINDSIQKVDFAKVHSWLSTAYWSIGIDQSEVEKGAFNSSIVVGAYKNTEQVSFLRVISDKTRFAYILDVYVDKEHRKKGLAKAMIKFVMSHPEFKDVYQWLLRTLDAHPIYREIGFKSLAKPENWLIIESPRTR